MRDDFVLLSWTGLTMRSLSRRFAAAVGLVLASGIGASAQQMPPSPVRYTEAREHSLRGTVRLPGTVESRTTSRVATEIAGLIEEFPGREGRTLKAGDPIAQLRRNNINFRLRSVASQLREAETRLGQAKRKSDRARELYDASVVSQQQVDDAVAETAAWQARVDQLTADKEQLEYDLERTTIRAPFDGVVVSEQTELGQWVKVGDTIVELLSPWNLEVVVNAPERYFRRLKTGTRTTVTFEALPGVSINGRISAVIPRADATARTFPLKIRIANRNGRVSAGMLAQVSFRVGTAYKTVIVPKDAVVAQGPARVVFRLNGDNTVESVPVKTGAGAGAWIAVTGSVKPGEKIITRGNERLRPGQQVQAEPIDYPLP